jgi:hypothetical protein
VALLVRVRLIFSASGSTRIERGFKQNTWELL